MIKQLTTSARGRSKVGGEGDIGLAAREKADEMMKRKLSGRGNDETR
jgi:hypothetical protein